MYLGFSCQWWKITNFQWYSLSLTYLYESANFGFLLWDWANQMAEGTIKLIEIFCISILFSSIYWTLSIAISGENTTEISVNIYCQVVVFFQSCAEDKKLTLVKNLATESKSDVLNCNTIKFYTHINCIQV